jgi:hypothetical protein
MLEEILKNWRAEIAIIIGAVIVYRANSSASLSGIENESDTDTYLRRLNSGSRVQGRNVIGGFLVLCGAIALIRESEILGGLVMLFFVTALIWQWRSQINLTVDLNTEKLRSRRLQGIIEAYEVRFRMLDPEATLIAAEGVAMAEIEDDWDDDDEEDEDVGTASSGEAHGSHPPQIPMDEPQRLMDQSEKPPRDGRTKN